VVLEWLPASGVADLDGYGLWRSTDGGVTFIPAAAPQAGSTTT
jgi:hypothetical protein